MRFGIFIPPFHNIGQNPTLALERDLELVQWVERLGFEEAWVGEHHSAGEQFIGAPEVFIAVAAERTKRIRLGTGVLSLPYQHPLIVADRMVLLDHLTRGRIMLGVGPGALASDAYMMGVDPTNQRRMMEESLEAIVALLTSEDPVNRQTDWFTLRNAQLHLRPFTVPRFEIAVAATVSPAGPTAAGRFGCSLLSIGAMSVAGFEVLANHWRVAEEAAREHEKQIDRRNWRLTGLMHLAETEEQAREEVNFGLDAWLDYFQNVSSLPLAGGFLDELVESGLAVVGTPDNAIHLIETLQKNSGGFGTYLIMAHEWANRAATLRSLELFAQYVVPHFQGSFDSLARSRRWASENKETFSGQWSASIAHAIQDHYPFEEEGARNE